MLLLPTASDRASSYEGSKRHSSAPHISPTLEGVSIRRAQTAFQGSGITCETTSVFVNPNPEWLTVKGSIIPFVNHTVYAVEINYLEPETFEKAVPPYGWLQFRWAASQSYGSGPGGFPIVPTAGFIISLTPDKDDLPYYAYASVVFTPNPESGNQLFNDPMFVPAEPGYVAPFAEVYPPKDHEK